MGRMVRDSDQLNQLQRASHEDAKVKTTVQDIIYDIEREARHEISRLKAEVSELSGRCIELQVHYWWTRPSPHSVAF